jgi:acyl carrier protein
MDRKKILNSIKGILKKSDYYFLQDIVDGITEKTEICEDLSMDSIQIMEFIVDIETAFDIRFDFSEIDANNIRTIEEIINMIADAKQTA